MMLSKNEQIRKTRKETRERRASMDCKTCILKIDTSKLNRKQKKFLEAIFREAKWLRNSELAKLKETNDFSSLNPSAKTAKVKLPDGTFETRSLSHLGSQIVQSVVDSIKQDILNLSKSKKKGNKVGALRFKSDCRRVPLRQYRYTFKIDFERETVRIQKCKKPFFVHGLKQIPKDAEIATANLIRKPSGYEVHVTYYVRPGETVDKPVNKLRMVGIDFGIGHNLTLSTGETFDIDVPEPKDLKLSSQRMNRGVKRAEKNGVSNPKRTSNHKKRKAKVARAYERLSNQKRDRANKIVSYILTMYDYIAIQDELIKAWHAGLFGKQVQHSYMGYIIAKLKKSPKVHVVPSSFPSTQMCLRCGKNTKHPLDQRSYHCEHCGFEADSRDIKAAWTILLQAVKEEHNVSLGQRLLCLLEETFPGSEVGDFLTSYLRGKA